jgi:hypothetical protein
MVIAALNGIAEIRQVLAAVMPRRRDGDGAGSADR